MNNRNEQSGASSSPPEFIDFNWWDVPLIPDERFQVAMIHVGGVTVFMPAAENMNPATSEWQWIDGTRIVLLGSVESALCRLIENYTTKELVELLSIQAKALHRLRLALGLPAGATGQRGGARPKAGRKARPRQ
jgi:hypothetical protein